MSATDAAIQKKMYGSGTKTVNFSNKDLDDMTKIVKVLEDSDVLKTLKNDIKKGGALPLIPMLLGTLGASLLTGRGIFSAGKGMYRELIIKDKELKKIINTFSSSAKL